MNERKRRVAAEETVDMLWVQEPGSRSVHITIASGYNSNNSSTRPLHGESVTAA